MIKRDSKPAKKCTKKPSPKKNTPKPKRKNSNGNYYAKK